jgi:hypothetical protein
LLDSAFSVRFAFGAGFSDSFFFGDGDFSGSGLGLFLLAGDFVGSGVSVASAFGLRFGLGVTSSSSSDFLPSDFAFGFGVGDSSSSAAGVFFGRGVLVGSGVSVDFGFALEVVFFFVFDFRFAGFGLAFASDFSAGVGEATARISSRALRASRFFFSSSVSWAWTSEPRIAPRARAVPKKTRSRITAGERNRETRVINSRKFSGSGGLGHGRCGQRGPVPFPPQNRV